MTDVAVREINDVERLKKINAALISRVERSMDQQGNAFSLFQTAINLENRIKSRTEELHATMRRLEQTNIDLIAAKESAEQANISKTRFLAAASHDVLQPLNAAHLSVSALAELQTSPRRQRGWCARSSARSTRWTSCCARCSTSPSSTPASSSPTTRNCRSSSFSNRCGRISSRWPK